MCSPKLFQVLAHLENYPLCAAWALQPLRDRGRMGASLSQCAYDHNPAPWLERAASTSIPLVSEQNQLTQPSNTFLHRPSDEKKINIPNSHSEVAYKNQCSTVVRNTNIFTHPNKLQIITVCPEASIVHFTFMISVNLYNKPLICLFYWGHWRLQSLDDFHKVALWIMVTIF